MNNIAVAVFAAAALTAVIISAVIVYRNNKKTAEQMDRISGMLNAVMNGSFSEKTFDESRMSAIETEFAEYLSSSALAAGNLKKERDKIRSLISDISHQTKTPISNLLLYCELLEEEELSDTVSSYVESIHGQTEKLRFLIDSLLKLSRLENGIIVLSPERNAVQPMLENVYSQYREAAEEKGLRLILRKTDSTAVFDPKWTAEAICNIVDNAVKYTDSGKIEISADVYSMFVRIDISDTGQGIREEEYSKIFARFYRSAKTREEQGAGIGLYLAREILNAEGGYVKVSSVYGEGSVFSVFLPLQRPDEGNTAVSSDEDRADRAV